MPGLARGDYDAPVAQQTIFGWVLTGPISAVRVPASSQVQHCSLDHELQELITRFWRQEETPATTDPARSPEEDECERHFLSTHSRDCTERYIVRLPLKTDPSILGDSKSTALGCLRRLSQRLSSDPDFKQLYVNFVEEYKTLGHMTIALTPAIDPSPVFYFPHHGVFKRDSNMTKLRVVFNGSSRTSNGASLNDILHTGAKLQRDIADVLLWNRAHRVVFSTDIVKMYRQVAVHQEHWDLQRVLWFDQSNHPVAHQLTTVTYGLSCAPFLALRALQQLKWSSNYRELLPRPTLESPSTVEIEPTLTKILGLVWKPQTDTFHFTAESTSTSEPTKRAIASDIAKLYDPLGLISPVLIRAKMLLQELWLLKIGWDEPLPPEICQRWASFRNQLPQLDHLSIPRWLGLGGSRCSPEIHGFSDASQLAMAAAVYVRVPAEDGSFSVRLVGSKTRVAPLKRLSVPRLELAAAVLLARLVRHTSEVLGLVDGPLICWTDSSVAYSWITSHPSRWKDFVRNRLSSIQEVLPLASWRFVPGKENPADCATRGLRPDQLAQHGLWWEGPCWLSKTTASLPKMRDQPLSEIDLEERAGQITIAVTQRPEYWELLDKYSSLTKLVRVTATCRRAVSRLRHTPQTSSVEYPLIPMELEKSRLFWIGVVQLAWFSHEIRIVTRGEQLPRSNSLGRLLPFVDRHGLLRVGGRLHNASIDPESKHPFILPRRSPLSTLIIADAHRRTLHGGTQVTLSLLRQSYWIVGGRAPVRSYILRCGRCARYRATRAKQLMGQLPSARVSPARPFLNSGLDYAGPVTLKTWRGRAARTYKGYLAIFICMATSAAHLEVVTDYTTEAFMAAYKRFTGRRGICASLHSDCGTNFVGADAELRRRFDSVSKESQHLVSLLANDGTEWRFNPPAAPHFGGKWEAAVKSTKYHLLRVLGDTSLTYEELTTVVVQIEAVLISRPLCPLSDDARDYAALTPGHILIGGALAAIPEPDLTTISISKLSRWQLLQQKVQHFWSRWSSECLQRHLAVSKWHNPSNDIKIGSLVLITDERYPPSKWPLARVTHLHPGPDGLTRVVTLRTTSATLKRSIAKLCVLPIDPD